jgi:hypothetical protein
MGIYGHTWDKYRIDLHPELIDENAITDALKKFVDGIKKVIVAAIDKINSLLDKHPDSKIAQGLKNLLTKFRNFLTRANKVSSKEEATSLKSDVDKANEELKGIEIACKYKSITVIEGVKSKNLSKIREALGTICYTSRDFRSGAFDAHLKYVLDSGIDIFEEYNGEPLISEKKKLEDMNDDDFSEAVFELKENFCKERINDVKKIGKYLYGNSNNH